MSKLTIKSGKGELNLKKSKSLVGLKTTPDKPAEKDDYVEAEVHTNLGGFQVVSLKKDGEDIDTRLDEVRQRDEVEVGTHVYYAEGSNKPLVATGDIYITFQEGVSEGEQRIVLEEHKLEIVECRSE